MVDGGEVWLRGAHIPPYLPASDQNHDPDRPRKLLLHRREIERLIGKTAERGLTLVPTRIYFKGPRAKVELALAKGKEGRDRRRDIRDRDLRREVERDFKQRLELTVTVLSRKQGFARTAGQSVMHENGGPCKDCARRCLLQSIHQARVSELRPGPPAEAYADRRRRHPAADPLPDGPPSPRQRGCRRGAARGRSRTRARAPRKKEGSR